MREAKYMAPLAIAQYLTEGERELMVLTPYDSPNNFGRRTREHRCPLGVALTLSDVPWRGTIPCPTAHHVGRALGHLGRGKEADIAWAAAAFIDQWDAGDVTPEHLPAALGLVHD